MSRAMQNEHLVARERLEQAYAAQLAAVTARVEAGWERRAAELDAVVQDVPDAAAAFATVVRAGLADAVKAATDHELVEQVALRKTEDFKEGVKAVAERRPGNFTGT